MIKKVNVGVGEASIFVVINYILFHTSVCGDNNFFDIIRFFPVMDDPFIMNGSLTRVLLLFSATPYL